LALAIGTNKTKIMIHTEFKGTGYNLLNGQFLKGHESWTKGKPWKEWMPKDKQKKIIRNLNRVRPKGGNPALPGSNRRRVVCINADGECVTYKSATSAAQMLSLTRRNICHCCQGKRKHCGGYRWFYFDDDSWTKLVKRY
jgi:hypothetical protein